MNLCDGVMESWSHASWSHGVMESCLPGRVEGESLRWSRPWRSGRSRTRAGAARATATC